MTLTNIDPWLHTDELSLLFRTFPRLRLLPIIRCDVKHLTTGIRLKMLGGEDVVQDEVITLAIQFSGMPHGELLVLPDQEPATRQLIAECMDAMDCS